MQKEQENCLEIIFHSNAQIVPNLLGTADHVRSLDDFDFVYFRNDILGVFWGDMQKIKDEPQRTPEQFCKHWIVKMGIFWKL